MSSDVSKALLKMMEIKDKLTKKKETEPAITQPIVTRFAENHVTLNAKSTSPKKDVANKESMEDTINQKLAVFRNQPINERDMYDELSESEDEEKNRVEPKKKIVPYQSDDEDQNHEESWSAKEMDGQDVANEDEYEQFVESLAPSKSTDVEPFQVEITQKEDNQKTHSDTENNYEGMVNDDEYEQFVESLAPSNTEEPMKDKTNQTDEQDEYEQFVESLAPSIPKCVEPVKEENAHKVDDQNIEKAGSQSKDSIPVEENTTQKEEITSSEKAESGEITTTPKGSIPLKESAARNIEVQRTETVDSTKESDIPIATKVAEPVKEEAASKSEKPNTERSHDAKESEVTIKQNASKPIKENDASNSEKPNAENVNSLKENEIETDLSKAAKQKQEIISQIDDNTNAEKDDSAPRNEKKAEPIESEEFVKSLPPSTSKSPDPVRETIEESEIETEHKEDEYEQFVESLAPPTPVQESITRNKEKTNTEKAGCQTKSKEDEYEQFVKSLAPLTLPNVKRAISLRKRKDKREVKENEYEQFVESHAPLTLSNVKKAISLGKRKNKRELKEDEYEQFVESLAPSTTGPMEETKSKESNDEYEQFVERWLSLAPSTKVDVDQRTDDLTFDTPKSQDVDLRKSDLVQPNIGNPGYLNANKNIKHESKDSHVLSDSKEGFDRDDRNTENSTIENLTSKDVDMRKFNCEGPNVIKPDDIQPNDNTNLESQDQDDRKTTFEQPYGTDVDMRNLDCGAESNVSTVESDRDYRTTDASPFENSYIEDVDMRISIERTVTQRLTEFRNVQCKEPKTDEVRDNEYKDKGTQRRVEYLGGSSSLKIQVNVKEDVTSNDDITENTEDTDRRVVIESQAQNDRDYRKFGGRLEVAYQGTSESKRKLTQNIKKTIYGYFACALCHWTSLKSSDIHQHAKTHHQMKRTSQAMLHVQVPSGFTELEYCAKCNRSGVGFGSAETHQCADVVRAEWGLQTSGVSCNEGESDCDQENEEDEGGYDNEEEDDGTEPFGALTSGATSKVAIKPKREAKPCKGTDRSKNDMPRRGYRDPKYVHHECSVCRYATLSGPTMLIHYSKCDHARFAKTLKVNVGTGFNVLQRCHDCTFQTYGQANHQCCASGTLKSQLLQNKDGSGRDGPNKEDIVMKNPKLGNSSIGGGTSANTTERSSDKGNSKVGNQNTRNSAENSIKGKADVGNNNSKTMALGKADVGKNNVPVGSATTDSKGGSQTNIRKDHMTKSDTGNPTVTDSASKDSTAKGHSQQKPIGKNNHMTNHTEYYACAFCHMTSLKASDIRRHASERHNMRGYVSHAVLHVKVASGFTRLEECPKCQRQGVGFATTDGHQCAKEIRAELVRAELGRSESARAELARAELSRKGVSRASEVLSKELRKKDCDTKEGERVFDSDEDSDENEEQFVGGSPGTSKVAAQQLLKSASGADSEKSSKNFCKQCQKWVSDMPRHQRRLHDLKYVHYECSVCRYATLREPSMGFHLSKSNHNTHAKTLEVRFESGFTMLRRCPKCTFQTYGQAKHQCGEDETLRGRGSRSKEDSRISHRGDNSHDNAKNKR